MAPAALQATMPALTLWISLAVIHRPGPFPPLLPSFAYTPARTSQRALADALCECDPCCDNDTYCTHTRGPAGPRMAVR